LVSTKLDTFAIRQCKLYRATCRRFDTIPECDGRTDGQTDGIAIASTALAIAARCKNVVICFLYANSRSTGTNTRKYRQNIVAFNSEGENCDYQCIEYCTRKPSLEVEPTNSAQELENNNSCVSVVCAFGATLWRFRM